MQTDLISVQLNIFALSKQKGVPLSVIGEQAGVAESYFYDVRSEISKELVDKVADFFEVSVSVLHQDTIDSIDSLPGNVGLLTRLRYLCNMLYISRKRFFEMTGIDLHKAYLQTITNGQISDVAGLFGVSENYLRTGENETEEKGKVEAQTSYLIWKLSGCNMGEERDLIIQHAKKKKLTLYDLRKLFRKQGIPIYLLDSRGERKLRPNMTSIEAGQIAELLNIPVRKLLDVKYLNDCDSSKRLPISTVLKEYPDNLLEDIQRFYGEQDISRKKVLKTIHELTAKQQYYIHARYVEQKTYLAIAEELGVTKQAVENSVKKSLRRIVEKTLPDAQLVDIHKYPENILHTLHRYSEVGDRRFSIREIENAVMLLSVELQELYHIMYREGKDAAIVCAEWEMSSDNIRKIYNKKKHLNKSILRQLLSVKNE